MKSRITPFFLAPMLASLGLAVSCSPSALTNSSSSSLSTNLTQSSTWTPSNGEFIRSVSVYQTGNNGAGSLYAAAGYDGVICFTISNNTNLYKTATNIVVTNYPVNDVLVTSDGKYLIALLGSLTNRSGYAIYDVSGMPAVITQVSGTNLSIRTSGNSLIEANNTLYIADEFAGVIVYTNSSMTSAPLTGPSNNLNGGSGVGIDISGSSLFVAAREKGVFILDSTTLNFLAQITMPVSYATAVKVSGNYLIIADLSGYVYFYNINKPQNPRYLGGYFTGGQPTDVYLNGTTDVFVAAGSAGAIWLDITTIGSPLLKGSVATSDNAVKLWHNIGSGGYLYYACGLGGIRVLKKL